MFWNKWFEPRPFYQGYLPEKDGHQVFFMVFGNPLGQPILCFHGGPGGESRSGRAALFDLKRFQVILFDQRGCGKSLPLGKTVNNTTQFLLDDALRIVNHLKIKQKIILSGASWGAALALLFAEKHPQMVDKLLLSQIFLADETARKWEFEGNCWFYPEFVAELEEKAEGNDVRAFFAAEINSKSLKKQLDAANYYGYFERVCGNLAPTWGRCSELSDKDLAGQRIYMHYAAQNFMLNGHEILDNVDKIRHIPAVLVHNRLDFVCPLKSVYDLHQVLPKSRLVVVPERGHIGRLLRKTIKDEFRKELKFQ